MDALLTDLVNCQKIILKIKTEYDPMYRNLMIFWTQRRAEIKRELLRI